MKPLRCKNCKYFVRDIFYRSEGICNNDGRYTREHRVCNLLDTDENKREAKIESQVAIPPRQSKEVRSVI